MPRDGSGIYTKPFPDVVTGTTIQSTVHNGTISDVAQDLNAPRPIVAGGTGASNARDAMTSLQGDVAYQVVTNYDAYAFVSGSFYSAAGATSAPTANAFIGQCYTSDPAVVPPAVPAGQNMFIEARDVTTGKKYIRQKIAGVWQAWTAGIALDIDAAYVNVSGDSMTGPLSVSGNIRAVGGAVALVSDGPVYAGYATATTGTYYFGNSNTKSLSYDGTNFHMAGGGLIVDAGYIMSVMPTASQGTYYFGNSGTKSLSYDGSNFNLTGGNLLVNGVVASVNTATTGFFNFGSSGTKYLQYDGTNFNLVGGTLSTAGIIATGDITNYRAGGTTGYHFLNAAQTRFLGYDGTNYVFSGAGVQGGTGYQCRNGVAGGYGVNYFNIMHGTGQQLWIDGSSVGTFAYTSDYRIKKDVIDLPGMWDTVKALRPIKYTQAQFSPPSHIEYVKQQAAKAAQAKEGETPSIIPGHLYEADDIERWGFIAHELQEVMTPSAASGVKDAYDTIQSPNPFTLIAALTKALQEAMTRIEALEAGA
jgi:hypothetical protein